jgi:hypothetical protein
MSRAMKALPLVLLFTLIIAVPSVWAYWVQDGVALCTATGEQYSPTIMSDGAGGAIVTWEDSRSGDYDIYAQRVNASGAVLWTTNGVGLATATGEQGAPTIISDGAGGAIVAWTDQRTGTYDIYAQRVNASGAVQWTTGGVAICAATGNQESPMIVSDGAGGAIVTWYDGRSGNYDIYAQRVNASGAAQWTTNGVALCTITGTQWNPTIVSDGAGGAIVTWSDGRSGNVDIYAQRMNASGAVQWAANGLALCTAAGDQQFPQIASDGAGGAIVTWCDSRSGTYDIYAQRVIASGSVHFMWMTNGVALCTAAGGQQDPQITSDGAGGAVVTWMDGRGGTLDIYAQRVNELGAVQWTADGAALCTATGSQYYPKIVSDGAAGTIITWEDYRSGNSDIYTQRVNASGAVQWTADGVTLCLAARQQARPTIASDGTGGAIVAWYDGRGGGNNDIYAQQVSSSGKTGFLNPAIHSIRDVPGDQGGCVNIAWDASRADYSAGNIITRYTIWRALSTPAALMMIENGAALLSGPEEISKNTSKPQVRMQQLGGRTFYWSLIDSHDAYYLQAYSKLVATAFDSSSATTQYNYFQIIAHTSDARTFFISAPDSARSVDNIAPCPPTSLAGEQSFTPVGLDLTWDRNTEADLGHYAVYRGTSAGFVPGAGNLIASPCDTTLLDGGWRWSSGYYYKVSAIDIHGNESLWAVLSPDGVTGTDTPKAPDATYLSQNYPNPFNPTTRIAFGLSAPAHVSLRIYNAAGRLVRVLVNEERRAARYEESWDGRDSNGRRVASGIYFYRLIAGSFEETRKIALMR